MDGDNVVPMHRDGIGVVHEDEMDFNPETGVDFIEIGGGGLSQFGVSSLYGLMWKVATVVIFWQAAFWAISGSEASFITDKIKSGGQAVGKYAATFAADQVPLPLGKGQGLTLANIGSLPRIPGEMLDRKMRTNMDEFKKANFPEAFGGRAAIEAQGRLSETMGSMKGRELNTDLATKLAQAIKKEGLGAINTRDSAQAEVYKKLGILEKLQGATTPEQQRDILQKALKDKDHHGAADIIGKAEKTGTGTTDASTTEERRTVHVGLTTEGATINYSQKLAKENSDVIAKAATPDALKKRLGEIGLGEDELKKVDASKLDQNNSLLKMLVSDLKKAGETVDEEALKKNLEKVIKDAQKTKPSTASGGGGGSGSGSGSGTGRGRISDGD